MSEDINAIVEVMKKISNNIDSGWSEDIEIDKKLSYRTYLNGEEYFSVEFTVDKQYKYSINYSFGETKLEEDIRFRLSNKQILKYLEKVCVYIEKERAIESEERKRHEIERLQKELNDKQSELNMLLCGDTNDKEEISEV